MLKTVVVVAYECAFVRRVLLYERPQGPMTVAMLMKATVEAWDRKVSKTIATDIVCAHDTAAQEALVVEYGDRRSHGARMDRQ